MAGVNPFKNYQCHLDRKGEIYVLTVTGQKQKQRFLSSLRSFEMTRYFYWDAKNQCYFLNLIQDLVRQGSLTQARMGTKTSCHSHIT